MKLETSNLAERWTAVCTDDKMQNKIKWGHVGSSDPLFEFWDFIISPGRRKLDPTNISGTNGARNFKFGTKMDGSEY